MKPTFSVVRVGDRYQIEKTEGGRVLVMYRYGAPLRSTFRGDLDSAVSILLSGAINPFAGTTWVSQHTVYQGGSIYPNMFMAKSGATARPGTFGRLHRIGAFNAL